MSRNRWTADETATLRRMSGESLTELIKALPRHTPKSIKTKRGELKLRERSQHRNCLRWIRICAAHKPRIILATAFPMERVAS